MSQVNINDNALIPEVNQQIRELWNISKLEYKKLIMDIHETSALSCHHNCGFYCQGLCKNIDLSVLNTLGIFRHHYNKLLSSIDNKNKIISYVKYWSYLCAEYICELTKSINPIKINTEEYN